MFAFVLVVLVNSTYWLQADKTTRFQKFEQEGLVNKTDLILNNINVDSSDRLIFGTSKTFRHFNTNVFDSVLNDNTKSINFGFANLFPFRLYDYIEYVLNDEQLSSFKGEIFIEITRPAQIKEINYNTLPIINSLNLNKCTIALDYELVLS